MNITHYISLVHHSETDLAKALRRVAEHHRPEPDIYQTCSLFAKWSEGHVLGVRPFIARYGESRESEPDRLYSDLFRGPRTGGLGLVRDLQDVFLMTQESAICWMVLLQASRALRDRELERVCAAGEINTQRQYQWLETRIKQAAPMALVAA